MCRVVRTLRKLGWKGQGGGVYEKQKTFDLIQLYTFYILLHMLNSAVCSLEDSPISYLLLSRVASYLHIIQPVYMGREGKVVVK